MESEDINVNIETVIAGSCEKSRGEREMIEVIFNSRKGKVCRTMSCLSITGCSQFVKPEHGTESEKGPYSERTKMLIWGMLTPEDEEDGFRLYLDSECYVLMLYNGEKLMALFDPYDYTLPELNDVLANVIQAIRHNPMVICSNRVFWSQN